MNKLSLAVLGISAALAALSATDASAASRQVERGKYLVNLGGCMD